jgi:transposase
MYFIGIDVSKHKLHVAYLVEPAQRKVHRKTAANSADGHVQLLRWAQRQTGAEVSELHFVLEATGVYHEAVAEALYAAGARVSVVNPADVHHFARSKAVVAKTDDHDARVLALFAHERRPAAWQPPPPEFKALRGLLQRLETVEADLQREHNRREKARHQRDEAVLESIDTITATLTAEAERLRRQIDDQIDQTPQLRADRQLLESIPGIGAKLARRLLALIHTHRFRQARQMAAYLGLAPRADQSGTIERPARLSKRGDAPLRALLYFPAIVAQKHNPDIAVQWRRLAAAGKSRMACIGAAMRKLVHIAFGVINNQTPYTPQGA